MAFDALDHGSLVKPPGAQTESSRSLGSLYDRIQILENPQQLPGKAELRIVIQKLTWLIP
jgi:hypothetical protein